MKPLAEILEVERLIGDLQGLVRTEVLGHSTHRGERLPIYKVSFGSTQPNVPVIGLTGGVHGLERIGAQVCVSLLRSLSQLILWDRNTQRAVENIRIVFIPTVNPWGILNKTRANPAGVDLMRNAPIDGEGKTTPLVGGHRFSARLPWYRGPIGGPMEPESQALVNGIASELKDSPLVVTVDFHSGFGIQDRIWFPYAKSTAPFPDLDVMHAFSELMEKTYPYHFYRIEPQALNYTTHGDLWDYLYEEHRKVAGRGLYLPLAIEMGSWNWVKKNPFQFFSSDGPYNPVKQHRLRRVLRRHNTFFDFLIRAVSSPEAWAQLNQEQKAKHQSQAMKLWYE